MVWKKTQDRVIARAFAAPEPTKAASKSKQEELDDAAKKLAASLRAYSYASYAAQQDPSDDELKAAHHKVQAARKIVTDGRIAYAGGCCLPERMAHWHAWSQRDDFRNWVKFDSTDITSSRSTEERGVRRIEVTANEFTFNGLPYRLVLRDGGLSSALGDDIYRGEVHFFSGDICVAKFSVAKDLMDEFARWEFVEVNGLRVGAWMQDVLDMAAQIEEDQEREVLNEFIDERARQAADEIDLG